jgi:hypothetical protein
MKRGRRRRQERHFRVDLFSFADAAQRAETVRFAKYSGLRYLTKSLRMSPGKLEALTAGPIASKRL